VESLTRVAKSVGLPLWLGSLDRRDVAVAENLAAVILSEGALEAHDEEEEARGPYREFHFGDSAVLLLSHCRTPSDSKYVCVPAVRGRCTQKPLHRAIPRRIA